VIHNRNLHILVLTSYSLQNQLFNLLLLKMIILILMIEWSHLSLVIFFGMILEKFEIF
jgi:hypothetical protein